MLALLGAIDLFGRINLSFRTSAFHFARISMRGEDHW
jgi:hypothetical protein